MIYLNVDADQKPEKVMMENLPGGAMTVRMADNIKEYRQEDAKDRKMYRFDEVVFELPADSTITTKQIEDDFEKYWEYGKTDQAGKDEDMKDDEPDPESGGMTRAEMTVEIQKLQEKNEMLEFVGHHLELLKQYQRAADKEKFREKILAEYTEA